MKRTVNKAKFEERANYIMIPRMLIAAGAEMSVAELNKKLDGHQRFTESEVNKISGIMMLTHAMTDEIFPPENE